LGSSTRTVICTSSCFRCLLRLGQQQQAKKRLHLLSDIFMIYMIMLSSFIYLNWFYSFYYFGFV
jgi:hypothetical protein